MPVDRTPYRRAVKALALLAVVLALYPLVRAFYAFEIDYNEGWNGYLQLRAAAGLPLYAGYPATFANNYPPLAFHVIRLAGRPDRRSGAGRSAGLDGGSGRDHNGLLVYRAQRRRIAL